MMIPMTGTKNDRSTTTISCWGVLMSEECSSARASDMQILLANSLGSQIIGHRYCVEEAWHGRASALPVHCPIHAPVAQLDRVSASEAEGRGFDSLRARQISCRACRFCPTFIRRSFPSQFRPSLLLQRIPMAAAGSSIRGYVRSKRSLGLLRLWMLSPLREGRYGTSFAQDN